MQLKLAIIPSESRSMTYHLISQLIYISFTTIPHMIEISFGLIIILNITPKAKNNYRVGLAQLVEGPLLAR